MNRQCFLIANVLFLSTLAFSCDRKIGVHPVKEHLPHENEIRFRIDFKIDKSKAFLPLIMDEQWVNSSFITDTSLDNNFDGLPPKRMDIDPSGNIYMLQVRRNRINVYNPQGEFIYSIGNWGRGPGEVEHIYSFDFSDDYSKLYILDHLDVEIYVFYEGKYQYKETFIHNTMNLNSLCVLKKGIYISGFSPTQPGMRNDPENRVKSSPIQRFDIVTYEHISSFGFEYRSFVDMPQFNRYMSRNVLACNETTDTVVGQMKDMPYMFGYTPDGEIKWISTLDNYQGSEFTETSNPMVTPTNDEVFYYFQDFREIHNSKYELIQTEYREPYWYGRELARGNVPELPQIDGPEYTTIMVDTETGELFLSGEYGVIGAIRDNRAILIDVERHPFGRDNTVILYEY